MTKRLPRAVLIARRGATTTIDTERGALYPVGRSRCLGVTLARLLACLDFVRWRFWGVGPESSIESCHFFSPSQAAELCASRNAFGGTLYFSAVGQLPVVKLKVRLNGTPLLAPVMVTW